MFRHSDAVFAVSVVCSLWLISICQKSAA